MPLPAGVATVTVTGRFLDAAGNPRSGSVSFTPGNELTDAGGLVIVTAKPVVAGIGSDGSFASPPLAATDNSALLPSGWSYGVIVTLDGQIDQQFTCLLPSSPAVVDFTALIQVTPATPVTPYLTIRGGQLWGPLILGGSPPLKIPAGAAAGDVLTSDASGNAAWGPITPAELPGATSSAAGAVELNTDLGGTASAPQVVATHLSSPLPVAQGGTGNTAGQPSGTASGDLGSTYPSPQVTGTHLASPLPLAQGGTAGGTQQAAINALTGTQSSGQYLRSNGTNASLAALQAADLTGTVPVSSGGTGSTTRNWAGLTTPTATKTANYTAAAGDMVIADISGGGFTVTLPSAPPNFTVAGVKVIATPASGINTLTVQRGGTDHIDISTTTSVTLSSLNQSKMFQYYNGIWTTWTGDLSLAQLDNRLGGMFNVRAYGAKGDGSTDDTAAIQAAANAVSAAGGGCLYFPAAAGSYKTTATITLSSYGDGIHVRGDGYATRVKATGNYDTFYVGPGNGVSFSYMYLDSTVGSNHTDFGSVTRTDSSCTTTSSSAVVTDASCKAVDLGRTVTGTGIPAGTIISSVTAGSQFTMTNAATASGTVSLVITDTSCNTTSGSAVVIDTQIGTVDAGKTVTGAGIPGGTTILSVVPGYSFTMSANATATASNVQLTITGSTAGAAINFQTGGTVRMNNMWCYNTFNGITCYNGGGRTEIVGCWIYGRNYGVYTQNPLHVFSTGISGDSVGVVSDSCNGSLWMIGCDINGICSLVCRNTLGIGQPNYGITLINVGANYNGGGVYPPEAILPGGTLQPIGFDMGSCYGELRMYACYASGASLRMGGRTDTGCGTTSGSPTVTDTAIQSTDLGKNVSGPGIPSGTVIQTVTPGVSFTMCQVVPASGSNVLATQAAVNATATATVSLLIGVATQDVEIIGGDYGADNSSPVHSIPQAIRIRAGSKIRISGIQCQGAATNAYNGIQLDAPVTGPVSITNCQWTQATLNCIDASAVTTGPFNFSGNQFNGQFTGAGVNYNATYAAQFTFIGNDAGSNLVNGSALGGAQYDGQVNTYTGPLTTDAAGITSTTVANFTSLGVAVTTGQTYDIEWLIYYQVSSGGVNNVGWGLSNPSATYGVLDVWSARSTTTVQENAGGLSSSGSFTQATATTTFPLKMRVVAAFSASGTVYPQLSAGTAGSSTLTVKAGSFAVARRIS